MAERTIAAVLKTAVGQPTVGSNPTPSASQAPTGRTLSTTKRTAAPSGFAAGTPQLSAGTSQLIVRWPRAQKRSQVQAADVFAVGVHQ